MLNNLIEIIRGTNPEVKPMTPRTLSNLRGRFALIVREAELDLNDDDMAYFIEWTKTELFLVGDRFKKRTHKTPPREFPPEAITRQDSDYQDKKLTELEAKLNEE